MKYKYQAKYVNRIKRFVAPLLLTAAYLMAVGAERAYSQTLTPSFQSEASYTFGQTLQFHLTAAASGEVADVMLFFQAPEFSDTFRVRVLFSPGSEITADYSVDLTQVRLSPFTTVTYWWILTTKDGDEIRVPEQRVTYEDNQFEWREVRQEGIRIYWTSDDPGLGQLTLDIITESLPVLETAIPAVDITPLRFYIYPSSADLRAALRLTGRDWVGGHADPEIGAILLVAVNANTAPTDLRQSIPHELTHFLLFHSTGANYDIVPVWFNEGLATAMEAAPYAGYELLLDSAIQNGTTIPFDELCLQFPATEERALLAYAQSASLIQFIKQQYGDQKLRELVASYADGADCYSGVERVLDMTLEQLNRAWLRGKEPLPPVLRFLVDNGIWLLLLIGGFGLTRLLFVKPSGP